MGNMHVIPTEADLHSIDEKAEPIKDFVPLTDKSPEWEHGANFCNKCSEPFDFVFVRKHHCHVCGLTYCSRCAPRRHLLNKARGCAKCLSKMYTDYRSRMLDDHTKPVAMSPYTQHNKRKFPAAEGGAAPQEEATTTTTASASAPEAAQQQQQHPQVEKPKIEEEEGQQPTYDDTKPSASEVSSDAEGPSPRHD